MSGYITQKPETIKEEIEFTGETKETAAHFSLALARGGLKAAPKRTAAGTGRGREGLTAEARAPGAAAPRGPVCTICSNAKLE